MSNINPLDIYLAQFVEVLDKTELMYEKYIHTRLVHIEHDNADMLDEIGQIFISHAQILKHLSFIADRIKLHGFIDVLSEREEYEKILVRYVNLKVGINSALAQTYAWMNDPINALAFLEIASDEIINRKQISLPNHILFTLYLRAGHVHRIQNNYEEAMQYYYMALDLVDFHDRARTVETLFNISLLNKIIARNKEDMEPARRIDMLLENIKDLKECEMEYKRGIDGINLTIDKIYFELLLNYSLLIEMEYDMETSPYIIRQLVDDMSPYIDLYRSEALKVGNNHRKHRFFMENLVNILMLERSITKNQLHKMRSEIARMLRIDENAIDKSSTFGITKEDLPAKTYDFYIEE